MIRFASRPASPFYRRACVLVLGAALLASTAAVAAPPSDDSEPDAVSRAVVEPTAPSAGKALNDALGHLAHDPRNVTALLEAGNAALALGDNEAALGFFTRADQVSPGNAAVKVAIAGARLHLDDPVEALRWYAEAERAGADPAAFALDRGLAFDLVGANADSIAQYRLVLARSRDPISRDEATRREALSLAIGGDRRGADLALLPLLQKQDRAAWRTHIFVLAIGGRAEDAVSTAHATMPADLAESISPYLRFMVRLTPAQQAAVASLGRFPRAADIGRDDPRVIAYTAAHPRVPLVVAAPVLAKAAPTAAELKAAHRRKGQVVATAPAPAPLPDIVMPAPPPPVAMTANNGPTPAPSAGHAPTVVARVAPVVPEASREQSHPSRLDLAQASEPARTPTPPPLASGPAISPKVPQPTVLSKLDMPPPTHRTIAPVERDAPTPPISTQYFSTPPRTATPAPGPAPGAQVVASPVVQPTPPSVAPPPTQTAAASPPVRFQPPIPEPTANAAASTPGADGELPAIGPDSRSAPQPQPEPAPVPRPVPATASPAMTAPAETAQHAVVEAVSPEKMARDAAANERAAKAAADAAAAKVAREKARVQAAKDKAAADAAAAEKAQEEEQAAKEKAAKDKAAKAKAAKAARDADDEAALEPCKPATSAKGRKGKGAAKSESAHSAKGKSAHGKSHAGKGRKAAADDSETCAPVAKGDRPDGPGDVSRDSDSDDSKAISKKDKSKAKGKDKDRAKDADSDKPEKGGRNKARYASRIWVQVLTGGDRDKMAGEWHAFVRKSHALKGRKPYLTPWHSNFRLLTGPFDSDAEAQAFIAELRKDGVSSYEWTSPAGQAIDSLGS